MRQVVRDQVVPDRRLDAGAPPPASAPPRRRRRLRLPVLAARSMPPLMALAAVCLYVGLVPHGQAARMPATPFDPEETLAAVGLGIDRISVRGHRRTRENQIFEAVDLALTRSELSLDTTAITRRLEQLPWVKTARLSRDFPGGIDIVIVERTAVAVASLSGRDMLLDAEGRVLGPASGHETGLVRVKGAGAQSRVGSLLALLGRHPELAPRLAEAERVGDRRWTLHLVTGTRVELPAGDDDAAESTVLRDILAGTPGDRLIDRPLSIIDARLPRRLVVRAGEPRRDTPAPF